MNLFPLSDLQDQIAKQLEARAPKVAMSYAFNDGSVESVQPEQWIPLMAGQNATLHFCHMIEAGRIALLNAFGLPVRADAYTGHQAIKHLATDEAGARLLFESAGLEWLEAAQAPQATDRPKRPPTKTERWREEEILRVLRELGYDPQALPKRIPGKPGVKAEVRRKLDWNESKAFDKAWDRLRTVREEISDA